jgi:hypothetical protein
MKYYYLILLGLLSFSGYSQIPSYLDIDRESATVARINIINATPITDSTYTLNISYIDYTQESVADSVSTGLVIWDNSCNRWYVNSVGVIVSNTITLGVNRIRGSGTPTLGIAAITDEGIHSYPIIPGGIPENIQQCIDEHFKLTLQNDISNTAVVIDTMYLNSNDSLITEESNGTTHIVPLNNLNNTFYIDSLGVITSVSGGDTITWPINSGGVDSIWINNDSLFVRDIGNGTFSAELDTYLQSLSESQLGTVYDITISNGNTIQIDVADNDNSTANELQQTNELYLGGDSLYVGLTSDGVSPSSVDLSVFLDNTDTSGYQNLNYDFQTQIITITSGTGDTLYVFEGASLSGIGYPGLVPEAAISDTLQFLRGDGTWANPTVGGDNWGSQVVQITGSLLSGDGTGGNPLTVNDTLSYYVNDISWTIAGDSGDTEYIITDTLTFTGAGITTTNFNAITNELTITSTEVDGSVTNEGSLTVGVGTGATSVISSNTSGSTPVTLEEGVGIELTESGNTITITNTLPDQTVSLIESDNITITGSYPSFTISAQDTSGYNQTFTIDGDSIRITDANTNYAISTETFRHVDGDILWVSEDGNNATAVIGDMHQPFADPWAALDSWTDGDLIYVLSGNYDFGPTSSGATYEFADMDEANLFDGVNDGESITYFFAPNTSVVKTTPFDFSLLTTQALFYADTSATYSVYGYGNFEVDATNANTSVVQVDDADANLYFQANEIKGRTFCFAIYEFDEVYLDINKVRQARVGDVAVISFRERANQTDKKFYARIRDYNNFPGNSHFSGLVSTRCCGTDVEFTDSNFEFHFDNIVKYDPLTVSGGASGSDVGYVFGLVHDSQLHNSTWTVNANSVRYYDLGTGSTQSNDSTLVVSSSYINQPAIVVGNCGLDNSTVTYNIGSMVSDFPCIGVNWQANGTAQTTEGRVNITGNFLSTNTYTIIYDTAAGAGTDSTKTITFRGSFESKTHPVIGDRRGVTSRSRMVYQGATLGSFIGDYSKRVIDHVLIQTDSIVVKEQNDKILVNHLNGYNLLELNPRDTLGNSIIFYDGSYPFVNDSPAVADTSVQVWINGIPQWLLKSDFGGVGGGSGTDTSGYNISFAVDGDSIRLTDGDGDVTLPMDDINKKTSWNILIYGNSLSIGFEDTTDVGFEYIPNLWTYNQETKVYEPAIADTTWVQNPPGGYTNIPRLQLTEVPGEGTGAERNLRHGNPTYWAAVKLAKANPNDTIFLSYGSRGGQLSDSLINEYYLDTLSVWIDEMALAGGTYFDYVVFGGGPQETSPEFQNNMVKYFEWLRDTKGVIDESTIFLIQSTSNNSEINSVIEALARNRTQYKIVPGADAFATLDGVHLTAQGHKSLGLTMYEVMLAGQEATVGDTLGNVGLYWGGISAPGSEGNLLYLPSHPDDNQTDSMDYNIMLITGMDTIETNNYPRNNVIGISNPNTTYWSLNDSEGLTLFGSDILYNVATPRNYVTAFGRYITTNKFNTKMFGDTLTMLHTGVGAFGSDWTSSRNYEYFFGEPETNYFTFGSHVFDFSTTLTASEDGYGLYYDHSSGEFKLEAPPSGGGGVTDHGALTGLTDDDHTQYLLLAGRAGGQEVTTVATSDDILTLEGIASQTGDYLAIDSAGVRKVTIAQDGSVLK